MPGNSGSLQTTDKRRYRTHYD